MKVLLAEDDAASRVLLRGLLTKWGYTVSVVEDGEAAWKALDRDDAPDIALVDWMMPRLSGMELCTRVRSAARQPSPYVVLLTARQHKTDLVVALDAGADDYLVKPFDPGELAARLRVAKRSATVQRELVESRDWIRRLATVDVTTGLLNRSAIATVLAGQLAQGVQTSVVLAAIDDFPALEARHGIVRMQGALRVAGERISAALPDVRVGRYATDTFLVVLPQTSLSNALELAERARRELWRAPVEFEDQAIDLTLSAGVAASGSKEAVTPEWLLYSADTALYVARNSGNRVETFGLGTSSARPRVSDSLSGGASSR